MQQYNEYFNEAKLRYIYDKYYDLFPGESSLKDNKLIKFIT